jgi:hypothetical protein
VRAKTLDISRPGFGGFLRQVVFLRHLFADGGKLRRHLVLEFLDLGARLCGLAGLCGIALFKLGLTLQDNFSRVFPLRVHKQVLQILIRKRGNPVVCPVNHRVQYFSFDEVLKHAMRIARSQRPAAPITRVQ